MSAQGNALDEWPTPIPRHVGAKELVFQFFVITWREIGDIPPSVRCTIAA